MYPGQLFIKQGLLALYSDNSFFQLFQPENIEFQAFDCPVGIGNFFLHSPVFRNNSAGAAGLVIRKRLPILYSLKQGFP